MRNKTAAAAKSDIMKGDKLERQGGSGSQEQNHEGRQAWETRRQRQPKAKNHEGRQAWGDKPAAAAKSEIMKGDKLEKQDGNGSQFPQSGTHPLRTKNPYSFQGKKHCFVTLSPPPLHGGRRNTTAS